MRPKCLLVKKARIYDPSRAKDGCVLPTAQRRCLEPLGKVQRMAEPSPGAGVSIHHTDPSMQPGRAEPGGEMGERKHSRDPQTSGRRPMHIFNRTVDSGSSEGHKVSLKGLLGLRASLRPWLSLPGCQEACHPLPTCELQSLSPVAAELDFSRCCSLSVAASPLPGPQHCRVCVCVGGPSHKPDQHTGREN